MTAEALMCSVARRADSLETVRSATAFQESVFFGFGQPEGQAEAEVGAKGEGVGFVEPADISEALHGGGVAAEAHVHFAEGLAELEELFLGVGGRGRVCPDLPGCRGGRCGRDR